MERFFRLLFLSLWRFLLRRRPGALDASLLSESLPSSCALAAAINDEEDACRLAASVPKEARAACCSRSVRAARRSSASCVCGVGIGARLRGTQRKGEREETWEGGDGGGQARWRREGTVPGRADLEGRELSDGLGAHGAIEGCRGAVVFRGMYHLRVWPRGRRLRSRCGHGRVSHTGRCVFAQALPCCAPGAARRGEGG